MCPKPPSGGASTESWFYSINQVEFLSLWPQERITLRSNPKTHTNTHMLRPEKKNKKNPTFKEENRKTFALVNWMSEISCANCRYFIKMRTYSFSFANGLSQKNENNRENKWTWRKKQHIFRCQIQTKIPNTWWQIHEIV